MHNILFVSIFTHSNVRVFIHSTYFPPLPQSLPDVFVKEQIYSLPSEEHLVRRGGNGQIFSVEYSGYNLVAKKTHFRSREFAIMQQVKHANVLPLLALMVGEAAHRRRFYCYHMLPKMSGRSLVRSCNGLRMI